MKFDRSNEKLEVGDVLTGVDLRPRRNHATTEMIVMRVGRKYFYATTFEWSKQGDDLSHTWSRFDMSDWREAMEHSLNWKLYKSLQEVSEEREWKALRVKICRATSSIKCDLSLAQLRAMKVVLDGTSGLSIAD